MLRAIVGTVAVVAGFGVIERSVDAGTGSAGSCMATQAYALLERGERVSVRAEPTPLAPVIGTLSGRGAEGELAASELTIMGARAVGPASRSTRRRAMRAPARRHSRPAGCQRSC